MRFKANQMRANPYSSDAQMVPNEIRSGLCVRTQKISPFIPGCSSLTSACEMSALIGEPSRSSTCDRANNSSSHTRCTIWKCFRIGPKPTRPGVPGGRRTGALGAEFTDKTKFNFNFYQRHQQIHALEQLNWKKKTQINGFKQTEGRAEMWRK